MDEANKRFSSRSWLPAVLLTLVTSTLWDFFVRPGLTKFGTVVLTFLSFGSDALENAIYRNAALDPTAVPSMGMAIGVMLVVGVAFPTVNFVKGLLRSRPQRPPLNGPEPSAVSKASGRLDPAVALLIILWLIAVLSSVITILVIQGSVSVWREFHTNLRICTPYISPKERDLLAARFASMTKRQQYVQLQADMAKIAETNGTKLVSR